MPESRRVFKNKRFVITKKGEIVIYLAEEILKSIRHHCEKIEIAGSIRRKLPDPIDIDIVLIPKSDVAREKIIIMLKNKGKFIEGGEKRTGFKIKGVKVDLYYADDNNFGAMLLTYTGSKGHNIGLRRMAKNKNMLLNQYGLFERKTGKQIAGRTEEEIFRALGKSFKSPEKRK